MKFILVLIIVLSSHQVVAGWAVRAKIDAMTDDEKKSAYIRNEAGHEFSVYRITPDGAVWGNFALSSREFDQVDWRRAPIFRIDKHKPVDLSRLKSIHEKNIGVRAYEWEPKWVNFLLWHGIPENGIPSDIDNLMNGGRVIFRYYLSTGGYKDTEFTLEGAGAAIEEAVGVKTRVTSAARLNTSAFKRVVVTELKRCRVNGKYIDDCVRKVKSCKDSALEDIEFFVSCMK